MQQHKLIEDYLNKALPKTISKKQMQNLREELLCHILDKVDFYIEIGYDIEAATKKAVEEMGDAEPVCADFKKIYKAMPHIFFFLSIIFLTLSVSLYFVISVILINEMEFYNLFVLLISAEAALFSAIVFAVGFALSNLRITFEKKLKKIIALLCSTIITSVCLFAFWGFVNLYDWYEPLSNVSVPTEQMQSLFPYHNITDEKDETTDLVVYHVPGTDLIELLCYGNYSTDCSIDYDVRYLKTHSLFLNKKFAFDTLYGEKMIYPHNNPAEAGKKGKFEGITYTPYTALDFYAIMITEGFSTYFISVSDIVQSGLTFEEFLETAIEQYKITKQAVEDKVFLDIPFEELFKEKTEYIYYCFS